MEQDTKVISTHMPSDLNPNKIARIKVKKDGEPLSQEIQFQSVRIINL